MPYLLKNNKLEWISLQEDNTKGVQIIKTVEELNNANKDSMFASQTIASKDKIYTLLHENEGYIFRVTQSCWSDDSGLNGGLSGHYSTAGQAIAEAINYKHKVVQNGIEITKPKNN